MASADNKKPSSKLLIGCGVGCGALVMLAVVFAIVGAMWGRSVTRGFDNAVEAGKQLEERYPDAATYTPPPDGLTADQVERFLRVRESTSAARQDLVNAFGKLPLSDAQQRELDEASGVNKAKSVFGIMRSAFGLGGKMGQFFQARNGALLAQEMGMGEYTYLYAVIYYAGFDHPSQDGPSDQADFGAGSGGALRDLPGMVERQLAALPEDAPDDWRRTLQQEIERLASRDGVPWQNGLPDRIAAVLEPYRERLDSLYTPASNPFELTRPRKRNSFSFTID